MALICIKVHTLKVMMRIQFQKEEEEEEDKEEEETKRKKKKESDLASLFFF